MPPMTTYVIHLKTGEKLKLDLDVDGQVKFEGDIARFEEGSQMIFAVHMRDVVCIRSQAARMRPLQSHDED